MNQLDNLGISRLTNRNIDLIRTFGKIREVKDEGFYVDVDLILQDEGLEPYLNIPTLRSRYYNYPIRKGDLVMLLTLSHLQNDFFESAKFADFPAQYETYVAIPIATLNQFLNAKDKEGEGDANAGGADGGQQQGGDDENEVLKFENFFNLRTPELNFQLSLNEEKLLIKSKKVDYELYLKSWLTEIEEKQEELIKGEYKGTFENTYNSTFKAQATYTYEADCQYDLKANYNLTCEGNIDIKSSGTLTIHADTTLTIESLVPISIKTSESLGSLIAEAFNLIASSQTGPIPQYTSGVSEGPTMANGSALSAIASRILQVCN